MTDATATPPRRRSSILELDARTKQRNAAEARFRTYGAVAVGIGILALVILLVTILGRATPAFTQTFIVMDVNLNQERLDENGNRDPEDLKKVSTFGYAPLIRDAAQLLVRQIEGDVDGLTDEMIGDMISKEAPAQLRNYVIANPRRSARAKASNSW